jgi:hypothetical protein
MPVKAKIDPANAGCNSQNIVDQLLIDELAGVAWRFDVTKLAVADRYDA